MRRWLALLACVLAWAAQAAEPRIEADEPRAFGYQVGDIVRRHLTLHLPDGWTLDESRLPKPRARGGFLEVRSMVRTSRPEPGGTRHDIRLEYQIMLAPPAVRTIEIASMRFRVDSAERSADLLAEAWPVTVAPLAPPAVSPRRGLGELQPDRMPWLQDTGPAVQRLRWWAWLAAALVLALLVLHVGPPWRAARRQPFGMAWRALRRLPAAPADARWRTACKHVHEALNRSAGEVVFEGTLDRFVAARPAFAGLRGDLAAFLQRSRRAFFGDGAPADADGDVDWLVELSRRCHLAERGLA